MIFNYFILREEFYFGFFLAKVRILEVGFWYSSYIECFIRVFVINKLIIKRGCILVFE